MINLLWFALLIPIADLFMKFKNKDFSISPIPSFDFKEPNIIKSVYLFGIAVLFYTLLNDLIPMSITIIVIFALLLINEQNKRNLGVQV